MKYSQDHTHKAESMKVKTIIMLAAILATASLAVSFTKTKVKSEKKMKTYVLVHGAWAGKFAWSQVKPKLEKEGHKVVTLDLPAHGDDNTSVQEITLQSYVDAVVKILKEQNQKVVLVGHSMGGMVISQVAEVVPEKIEKLVFLSAYLPADGNDLQSISATDSESLIGPNLVFLPDYSAATIKPEFVTRVFGDGCSEEVKRLILEKHRPEPLAPFQGKVALTEAKFGSVPKYYIKTTKDVGVSTSLQERMIGANGKVEKVFTLDCGHSPYFAKSDELVSILLGL